MLNFKSREAARQFAKKSGHKVVDNGKESNKRWSVKVV